jgi:hypothetical protein
MGADGSRPNLPKNSIRAVEHGASGRWVHLTHKAEETRYIPRMTFRSTTAPRALSAAFVMTTFVAGLVVVPTATLALDVAYAQSSATTPSNTTAKTPFDATLASDAVVRCASSVETGYVFGSLPAGTSVRVLQEEPGWVRIATTGSAFNGWFGYVKASPGVTLSADGKSIKISSRAEITAPNADREFNPDASYRAIGFLLAGNEATVVDQVKGDQNNGAQGATYYAIALGNGTSGWIASSALSKPAVTTPTPATTTDTTKPAPTTTDTTTETVTDVKSEEAIVEVDTETGQVIRAETTTETATDVTTTDPNAKPEAKTDAKAEVVQKVKRIRVADLEASYKAMRAEPTETAEFEALRERTLAIAEDSTSTASEVQRAKFLAKKVELDITIQKDLREIAERKRKLDANFKGVADLEMATLTRMPYDNVGRLNASKFYTGERMPLLYVLQDPGTGYTIAYMVPDGTYDLSSMLGLVVGVKGPVKYDESLRLNVITPNSIVPITPKAGSAAGSGTVTATGSENTPNSDK